MTAQRERPRRPAPRLRTVLLAVHLLILCLPLAGIGLLRLYDSALVRQTEAELIVQGAAVAAAQRAAVHAAVEATGVDEGAGSPDLADFGRPLPSRDPSTGQGAEPIPFDPALPGLDLARHRVLGEEPAGLPPDHPAHPLAAAAGRRIVPQLEELQRVSLAAIRVLDPDGVVVASTGAETGLSLAHRPEVAAALDGRKASLLRERHTDTRRHPPLDDIQRGTPLRVVVAFPIEAEPAAPAGTPRRSWGVVVLSRTPMAARQALWRQRNHLVAGGLLVLVVMSLVTLITAATIGRPVRALIAQTERVVRGERDAATALERPGTHEIGRISAAVAHMARVLQERADYIGTFAANVSHEFKTPLTSIRGSVELLRDHLDDMSPQELDRFLSMLDRDARRLERLVDRLLELARADVHQPGLETTPVASALERLASRYADTNPPVTFDDRTDGGLGVVAMDPETLDSVLGNLLDNAVRHAHRQVHLTVRPLAQPGPHDGNLRFEVIDDGDGISEANLSRVFDRFFTTRRDDGGSGLGLSIVHTLVEAHGGSVSAHSAEGETCFSVDLPATDGAAGSEGNQKRKRSSP